MKISHIPVQLLGDNRLILWDHKKGNQLYSQGFYGKPLGVARPREVFTQPLILDSVEGLYLLEKEMITVYDLIGKTVSLHELRHRLHEETDGIDLKFSVYNELREKGYIVTPGIKYGCDFAVYEHGPGIDHAPYVIQIHGSDEPLEAEEVVKSGRLASTVRKSFIKAVKIDGETRFLEFNWWKA